MSLTTLLLVVNAAIFLLQEFLKLFSGTQFFGDYLALSLDGLKHFYFWQPITFQFLHANWFHLLANLVTIFFFGRPVEDALGKARFAILYLGGGLVGGLLQVLGSLVSATHLGGAVVGASAGAFGLVAAFATLFPERPLTLLVFFVLPITMRAKVLLFLEILITVIGIVVPRIGGNIAHVAHLGGIICGVAFVKFRLSTEWYLRARLPSRPIRRPRALAEVRLGKASWRAPTQTLEELPPAEFISKQVDPILDKISAHGIHSLTPEERRILEAASTKIGKR